MTETEAQPVERGSGRTRNREASDMARRTRRVRRPRSLWSDLFDYIVLIAVICVCFIVFLYLYAKSLVQQLNASVSSVPVEADTIPAIQIIARPRMPCSRVELHRWAERVVG